MDLNMNDHQFSGEDSIVVTDFLARFVRAVNIQEMIISEAFVAPSTSPKGLAKS